MFCSKTHAAEVSFILKGQAEVPRRVTALSSRLFRLRTVFGDEAAVSLPQSGCARGHLADGKWSGSAHGAGTV